MEAGGVFSRRDEANWEKGNRVSRDADLLGVPCGLGRVALLRGMNSGCIESPVRGKPLALREAEGAPLECGDK